MRYEASREEMDKILALPDEEQKRAIADLHRKTEEFEKGFAIGESLSALPCPARTTDPAIMGFLEAINRQHPTHQQNIFRVIYLLCRAWAENKAKGWYDLRNEATVEGAERIVKALDNLPIPYV
jgi:hypothetical protein